jgi:hypothetical protein
MLGNCIIKKLSPYAGCEFQHFSIWLPHVVWASSQDGSWIPRDILEETQNLLLHFVCEVVRRICSTLRRKKRHHLEERV